MVGPVPRASVAPWSLAYLQLLGCRVPTPRVCTRLCSHPQSLWKLNVMCLKLFLHPKQKGDKLLGGVAFAWEQLALKALV